MDTRHHATHNEILNELFRRLGRKRRKKLRDRRGHLVHLRTGLEHDRERTE